MALNKLAPTLLRPRRAVLVAGVALTLLAVAGCGGHKRTSLRPVYTSPMTSTVAAPCTNCGKGAGSVPVITGPSVPAGARLVPDPVVRASHR